MNARPNDQTRAHRVSQLLQHNIRTEIDAQLAKAGEELPTADRDRLAWGIAVEVLYAFAVDWDPDWVKAGMVHAWQESDLWFARCGVCLLDSNGTPTRDEATEWAETHQASHQKAGR